MLSIITTVLLALLMTLFVFAWILPIFAMDRLLIKPNRHKPLGDENSANPGDYPVSEFGFFTNLEPGQVKVKVTQNGTFVTCLMNWQGKHFVGENPDNHFDPNHREYWEVVDSDDLPDSHPITNPTNPIAIPFWLWKRFIYWANGAVWVGIPGFRKLRIYKLDRLVRVTLPDGSATFKRKVDYSDHYRVSDFQEGVVVPNADTSNLVELKVSINLVCAVTNPYLVAFNTDNNWVGRLHGAASEGVNRFTRPRPYKEVIAAKDSTDTSTAANTIKAHLDMSLKGTGLFVKEVQYLDATITSQTLAQQLAAEAAAEAEARGKERLAQANAAPIREIGAALQQYPEAADIPRLEAQVRIAQAAGDKAIIILGNTAQDVRPLEAASLRAQQRIVEQLSPETPPATREIVVEATAERE